MRGIYGWKGLGEISPIGGECSLARSGSKEGKMQKLEKNGEDDDVASIDSRWIVLL